LKLPDPGAAPLKLRRGRPLPNRFALAPMTNRQSNPDGTLGDDELRWLLARARGGFGLISTCAAYVSDEGKAWHGQLGIASEAHLAGLARLATAVRDAGSTGIVQLYHGGRVASLAPGARLSTADGEGVRAATEADLQRVISDFVAAARRAEQAGFDGVEIHGANGYLFTQFLAPDDNPRTDRWGGDLQGRARLLREVTRALRAAVSRDFLVGARISPVDTWSRRGLVLADAERLAPMLAEDGLDFLHLSLQDASGPPPHEPGAPAVATAIRRALPAHVALVVAGGVWTRDDAERALAAGADVVAIGKAAIVHADWPLASAAPAFSPTRPPWDPAMLPAQAVGPALAAYLQGFKGLLRAHD
jgi:2,4-dienoyl-CoA reductase-like NADH-dependent reductase (Old Yellow Enzyme family)